MEIVIVILWPVFKKMECLSLDALEKPGQGSALATGIQDHPSGSGPVLKMRIIFQSEDSTCHSSEAFHFRSPQRV